MPKLALRCEPLTDVELVRNLTLLNCVRGDDDGEATLAAADAIIMVIET
jgi:hypothetical protein